LKLAQALKVNATRAASPALQTIESIIGISTRRAHFRRIIRPIGCAAEALRGEWSVAGEEWPAPLAAGLIGPPVRYIRKTPNRVSGIGALRVADMASDSTLRVSAGSMTPSSQRRAVA